MKRPCDNCPFLRDGGIRLTVDRVKEIAGGMLDSQGITFACHKTTSVGRADALNDDEDEELVATGDSLHCAGALIFAEKNRTATQMMRIMERLRAYDHKALMADKAVVATVFDTLGEMVKVNRKAFEVRRRKAK